LIHLSIYIYIFIDKDIQKYIAPGDSGGAAKTPKTAKVSAVAAAAHEICWIHIYLCAHMHIYIFCAHIYIFIDIHINKDTVDIVIEKYTAPAAANEQAPVCLFNRDILDASRGRPFHCNMANNRFFLKWVGLIYLAI